MKSFWDDRYNTDSYIFGTEPNAWLAQILPQLTSQHSGNSDEFSATMQQDKRLTPNHPLRILFPAEGEGRNAVFAAKLGWQVYAFDMSSTGRDKAIKLAEKHGVVLDYRVGELMEVDYKPETFDVIVLLWAHFPASLQQAYHQRLSGYLRKGGTLLLEGYHVDHVDFRIRYGSIGGPGDASAMYTVESLRRDFAGFDIALAERAEVDIHESEHHTGRSAVVRFIGHKR